MRRTTSIIDAVSDSRLFRHWFDGATWTAWLVFLRALFGLPLSADETALYKRHTQRASAPQSAFREAWLVVGRRGGKSLIAALVAVFLACFRDYSRFLKAGEVGTVFVIAADRKQARTILRYIRGFLQVPMLRQMVTNETAEGIELSNRIVIEVGTCSFRSVRGYTLVAAIADEIAFWRTEESSNPDTEIIAALRPGLATIPGGLLLCISSPYARRGALWEAYRRHFGKDSPVLVWQGATQEMNSAIDVSIIQQAIEEDEPAARAEYFAEFRRDVETFVNRETLELCIIPDRRELPPDGISVYVGFVDPSGGSTDSFTLAIAHRDRMGRAILDVIREVRPPFSPAAAVTEFASLLKSYRVRRIFGDRYAGEWAREPFRQNGIDYIVAERIKSDLYRDCLPLMNSGRVELLDQARLISQFLGLERRASRGGRDSIDHPPRSQDDMANAAAGALVFASTFGTRLRTVGRLARKHDEFLAASHTRMDLQRRIDESRSPKTRRDSDSGGES